MSLLHSIFFGIFVLIMIYLGVMNAPGVVQILTSGSNALVANEKVLQGR